MNDTVPHAKMERPKGFIRFVLWAGDNKRTSIALYAALFMVPMLVILLVYEVPIGPAILSVVVGYPFSVIGAWIMWQAWIWPTYAAYPGSTILPPHIKVYDDSRPEDKRNAA